MLRTWKLAIPITLILGSGCDPKSEQELRSPLVEDSTSAEPLFNEALATRLGADDYGMRMYVIAFLKAGPNRDQDSITAAELQQAHLDNIRRLAEEGKLALAGPFGDDGILRGLYIFNVTTVEEASSLTETDPAIQAGRLEMELHPWYGSAAVQEVYEIHKRIQRKSF